MVGKWLEDAELPGFKEFKLKFISKVQDVSEKLMLCFRRGLGFPHDNFVKAHDVKRPESQTVARLLHYIETPRENLARFTIGLAHTKIGIL